MISPHGSQRERWLLLNAVEADRARRLLRLPEPAPWYPRGQAPPFPAPHHWEPIHHFVRGIRHTALTGGLS